MSENPQRPDRPQRQPRRPPRDQGPPRPPGPQRVRRPSPRDRQLWLLAAVAAVAVVVLVAFLLTRGGDDGPEPGDPIAFEVWKARANSFCSDGVQEAVALPLPSSTDQVAADAAAMSEIVINVRDAILPLGAPEDRGPAVDAYLKELNSDARLLAEISDTADNGVDPSGLQSTLDESAGVAALELELEDCAAFANAVARTP